MSAKDFTPHLLGLFVGFLPHFGGGRSGLGASGLFITLSHRCGVNFPLTLTTIIIKHLVYFVNTLNRE